MVFNPWGPTGHVLGVDTESVGLVQGLYGEQNASFRQLFAGVKGAGLWEVTTNAGRFGRN